MKYIKFLILLCLFIYGSRGEAQEITYTPYWHQVNTPHGHIKLGPNNTSWAHIYTDRPAFIFDKPVYSHGGQFSAYSNSNLTLQTAGTTRMTILKSNGNVGIGTSNPSAKLHIVGSANNASLVLDNENLIGFKRMDGALVYGIGHASGEFVLGASSNLSPSAGTPINIASGGSFIKFTQGSAERMRISNSGNIGIGTTTPDNKLDVKGTIRAEEVKVESSPWPDYVFSDAYQLSPLSEVSSYIQENHHLPGIPTAEEVAENGIKLGEMNAKLLEKVEELTLYLIEKDREIERLYKRDQQLIERIEKLENK